MSFDEEGIKRFISKGPRLLFFGQVPGKCDTCDSELNEFVFTCPHSFYYLAHNEFLYNGRLIYLKQLIENSIASKLPKLSSIKTYMMSLNNQNNMHSRLEIIRNSGNIYDFSM